MTKKGWVEALVEFENTYGNTIQLFIINTHFEHLDTDTQIQQMTQVFYVVFLLFIFLLCKPKK